MNEWNVHPAPPAHMTRNGLTAWEWRQVITQQGSAAIVSIDAKTRADAQRIALKIAAALNAPEADDERLRCDAETNHGSGVVPVAVATIALATSDSAANVGAYCADCLPKAVTDMLLNEEGEAFVVRAL